MTRKVKNIHERALLALLTTSPLESAVGSSYKVRSFGLAIQTSSARNLNLTVCDLTMEGSGRFASDVVEFSSATNCFRFIGPFVSPAWTKP